LWRFRLEPELRVGPRVTAGVSYEHRLRVSSPSSGLGGAAVLGVEAPGPYRVCQLDWPVTASNGSSWRHEIDRAYVAVDLSKVDVTAGRQAIGWGRGVLFGAVDLFAPFTPLEADREWRRGIDALRADVRLTDRTSLDLVAAFGEGADASVFAARFRGYAGNADLELMAGRRARDLFGGVTISAALGDAEVHGELALFRAPEPLPADGRRDAVKAVAGASWRLPVGAGLLVHGEYHYSGFAATSAADIPALLADPEFRERYLRGDTQILERHAVAVLGTYEASPEIGVSVQWLHAPLDGSGVLSPSATFTLGDSVSVLAAAYLPYGSAPQAGTLTSEYGAAARSALVQVRIYR
jgi:hypothetical protein